MRVRWTLRPRGARVRRRDCRPLPVKSRRQPCISSAKGGIFAIRRSDTTNYARYRKRYASHRRCVYHPSKTVYHQHAVLYTYGSSSILHFALCILHFAFKKSTRRNGCLGVYKCIGKYPKTILPTIPRGLPCSYIPLPCLPPRRRE